jgi:hypothetical protein
MAAMKGALILTLAIGICVAPILFAGEQSNPAAQHGQTQAANKAAQAQQEAAKAAQAQLDADRDAIRSILSALAQSQREQARQLSEAESEKSQEIVTEKKLATYTGLLVVVGVVQFVALTVQAIVFICTLRTFNRQTDELKISSAATKASADALINSERAIIAVDLKLQPSPIVADPISTNVPVYCFCENYGRTIATITEIRFGSAVVDSIDGLSKEPNLTETRAISGPPRIIAPEKSPSRFDYEVVGPARRSFQTFVIYGVVKYRHRFAVDEVQTGFGFSLGPSNSLERLNSHPQYNSDT